ncbi:MAG: leucine-rich repeat protein, partial [Alistipes sp.]|nr:leucine-rich repeat protein [Alistipes sp.]
MSEGFVYEAGKQSKFSIRLNKKGHTGEVELQLINTEIVEWVADLDTHDGEARQYYVVHQEEAGTLGQLLRAANKNPNKIKNLKISGKIDAYDFYFMRDQMEILQSINLKETEIVGCKWEWHGMINGQNVTEYFSTEMPQSLTEANNEVAARYPGATVVCSYYNSTSDYLDHEIPTSAFSKKSSLVNFVFPEKVTKISNHAFSGTTFSGALIIPDDVIEIGTCAFEETNISSLQLPVNLKRIGSHAFDSCKSLAGTLTLPESLESIGSNAFAACSMLGGTLTIPSQLTKIPDWCFQNCAFTGDLVIPNNIKHIGDNAFMHCTFNGQLTLSANLTKIGVNAFYGSNFQGELFIPKGVQSIEQSAFRDADFSKVVFEEESELVKLGMAAFEHNTRLSEPIILPEGLLSIGSQAFYFCSTLPSVVIPSTVTTIGNNAFFNCYYLTKLQCDATMPPICGSGAFDGVGKENLTLEVPEQSVALYQTAAGWSDFNRISAYYDFSIARKHIRTLNAAYSKSYLLRVPSGEAWQVESKPEWVTVTPASGVGRTEVTVSVNEMPRTSDTFTFEVMGTYGNWTSETHTGRAGEIVFLLESKDRRVKMDVQQYDYDYSDGEVMTNQTATVGGGVNIVFMGDCFDARDIATGSYL